MSIDPTRPLECPFCDFAGDAVIKVEHHYYPGLNSPRYFVKCKKCATRGPETRDRDAAVHKWNQAPRRRLLGR